MTRVLATSTDPILRKAIDTTKDMQLFLAAPDGVKNDLGQPAPEMEDKTAQLKRRLFKFYRSAMLTQLLCVITNCHSCKTFSWERQKICNTKDV